MDARESLSPEITNQHGHNTASTTQDNVHWNRDVIAKSQVIQKVDSKEQENIRQPSIERHVWRLKKKRRSCDGKVIRPRNECCKDKLHESNEKALYKCELDSILLDDGERLPLSGSSLKILLSTLKTRYIHR